MRIFLISDNTDTLMGFRLVGVDGIIAHSEDEVRKVISEVMRDKNVSLIMITERLVNLCIDFIYDVKFSKHVQIVQIPDRHGSKKTASTIINGYLQNALGITIK